MGSDAPNNATASAQVSGDFPLRNNQQTQTPLQPSPLYIEKAQRKQNWEGARGGTMGKNSRKQ
jgi:hypothetical protein